MLKLEDLILRYEKDFFNLDFCKCRDNIESRLSKYFFEYGQSGSIHNREEVVNALIGLTKNKPVNIYSFELEHLSKDILISHYTSRDGESALSALRTSVWKIEDGEWKMYFHQGTPCRK